MFRSQVNGIKRCCLCINKQHNIRHITHSQLAQVVILDKNTHIEVTIYQFNIAVRHLSLQNEIDCCSF